MRSAMSGKLVKVLGTIGAVGLGSLAMSGCVVGTLIGGMAESARRTGTSTVYSKYDGLRGKSFAIVIAADRVVQAADAGAVTRLTNSATGLLVANQQTIGFTGFVPGPRVLEFQYNTPSWTSWTYGRLADEFTVDRLIVVELYEYRFHEPGNAHVWDGMIAGRVGIVEAESGSDEFAFSTEIRIAYPDAKGFTPNDLSMNHIRAVLEKRFADRVAWLFFEHEEPNEIKY